jgi:hypothetical protein
LEPASGNREAKQTRLGSSILALFANERTQTSLFGFPIAASWFQSLNPVLASKPELLVFLQQ